MHHASIGSPLIGSHDIGLAVPAQLLRSALVTELQRRTTAPLVTGDVLDDVVWDLGSEPVLVADACDASRFVASHGPDFFDGARRLLALEATEDAADVALLEDAGWELVDASVPLDALVARITEVADDRVAQVRARPGAGPLTERQIEILVAVSFGLTTWETARRLGISPKTVENHKQRIFLKLGVQNQAHAVAKASVAGWLDERTLRRAG